MRKMSYFFYLLLFGFSIFSCDKNDTIENPVAIQYESCCGIEPVEYDNDTIQGRVYFPNVFTPNGDGVNDYFYPRSSPQDSLLFFQFIIFTEVGDTVLFNREELGYNYLGNLEYYGWDGNRPDGTPYEGAFRYFVKAANSIGGYSIEGKACRIVCGPDAAIFRTKEGCFYSEQVDQDGYFDATLPTMESNCFE